MISFWTMTPTGRPAGISAHYDATNDSPSRHLVAETYYTFGGSFFNIFYTFLKNGGHRHNTSLKNLYIRTKTGNDTSTSVFCYELLAILCRFLIRWNTNRVIEIPHQNYYDFIPDNDTNW